jgi:hypothetical protein
VPFSADLLDFASYIGKEDDKEEKPRSLVVTRPDVVLGGRISSGRERKSWKREEEEAEDPQCCLSELARADRFLCRPCLSLARLTVGLSRPQRGSGETHDVSLALEAGAF